MKLISHRGNLSGPNKTKENHPDYINRALLNGYDVEVDVWWVDKKYWLGHDAPQYEVAQKFINNERFWLHAKNYDALEKMVKSGYNCFWHQKDEFVLTNHGYIWAYPTKNYPSNTIAVLPELYDSVITTDCAGICSDYIKKYEEKYVANK